MTPPPRSGINQRRTVFRAAGMWLGASALAWRVGSWWAWSLFALTGLLLILSVLWPIGYAPIARKLTWLEERTQQAFSWFLLGLIFVLIFIPGRWIGILRKKKTDGRSANLDTYWKTCNSTPLVESFERQY